MPDTILQRLEKRQFDDLRGTRLHLELPVAKSLLNWYIHQLEESKAIRDLEVMAIQGHDVVLNLQTNIPFFKDRDIRVRFHEAVAEHVIRVDLVDGINFLERTVIAGFLPDGIQLDGRELTVDLRYVLREKPKIAAWLNKLQNLRIRGGQGRLFVICDVII